MAATTPVCDFGWQARDFSLPGVDGKTYRLEDVSGPKGTLLMFICNHCPYVQSAIDRIARDAAALRPLGIGVAAINSNDPATYPEDSFENMQVFARRHGLVFPYLYDESQDVARVYGAVCTPDFFGFNAKHELQYRGRIDEAGRNPPTRPGLKRELYEAMRQVAATGAGPRDQVASIGCSIKWRQVA
ncbi:MAG: thioredoxin family protein [Alphaproteobacteria bacterium]|nr:thioredoxin family protein [Alphaproteobacteria bacterium]